MMIAIGIRDVRKPQKVLKETIKDLEFFLEMENYKPETSFLTIAQNMVNSYIDCIMGELNLHRIVVFLKENNLRIKDFDHDALEMSF